MSCTYPYIAFTFWSFPLDQILCERSNSLNTLFQESWLCLSVSFAQLQTSTLTDPEIVSLTGGHLKMYRFPWILWLPPRVGVPSFTSTALRSSTWLLTNVPFQPGPFSAGSSSESEPRGNLCASFCSSLRLGTLSRSTGITPTTGGKGHLGINYKHSF